MPTAKASRWWDNSQGVWYSWAGGEQGLLVKQKFNGLWMSMTNEQPYIPYGESLEGSHSLAQMWGTRAYGGCESTVETGWTESAGQFNGNYEPHLFISAWDCGQFLGYTGEPGVAWVQSSAVIQPGSVLTHNDKFHIYGARMDGNNWWFYYDGQWVGYIPHSAWTYLYPSYLSRAEVGGEVATTAQWTCADMGYAGLFGTNPGAAMFGDVWYEYNYNTQSQSANMGSFASDPGAYVTGQWAANPAHAFRYGGPGWC